MKRYRIPRVAFINKMDRLGVNQPRPLDEKTKMLSELIRDERYSDELVNFYNPAYVAGLIYLSGVNFQTKKKQGMPLYFAYIVLPLLTVDNTRKRVPSKTTGRLADWVAVSPA